jgi:hypothetical protein
MAGNLTAILAELRAEAGPDVPIVGMTHYDVFAPLCLSDPSLLLVCSGVDAGNAALVDSYHSAGVLVADVAGAFENDKPGTRRPPTRRLRTRPQRRSASRGGGLSSIRDARAAQPPSWRHRGFVLGQAPSTKRATHARSLTA